MANVENEGIFTSEATLSPEFVPETPIHRESQLQLIEDALKPALANTRPDNLFLFGPTGAGKTTCAKFTCKQLSEYKPSVYSTYINCWEFNTRLAVLSQIAGAIGIGFPRRGLAGDEVFSRIIEMTKKSKSTIIVFLDEFDQLCLKKEEGIVYDLTRAGENHGVNIGIVCISNKSNLLDTIDKRILSSFSPLRLEFQKYSPAELKDILRERAKSALRPGSWNEEVIGLCAGHAAKLGGDCRIALRCLWRAARFADRDGIKITEQHIRSAFEEKGEQNENTVALNEIEKKIVELLQANQNSNGMQSGKMYELLQKITSERTARNTLNSLAQRNILEIIEVEGKEIGGRGKSRLIKLKQKTTGI